MEGIPATLTLAPASLPAFGAALPTPTSDEFWFQAYPAQRQQQFVFLSQRENLSGRNLAKSISNGFLRGSAENLLRAVPGHEPVGPISHAQDPRNLCCLPRVSASDQDSISVKESAGHSPY